MPLKRRRKIHGLYYHSSPPKVIPMNQPSKTKAQDTGKEAIIIKPSNIRIWIHDKDVGKLSKVLWEGQGNRLRTEVCSNGKVKRFLEGVPYVMNTIKDIHSAVVDNDLDQLIAKSSSVPAVLLSSKDVNGLTPLHKASGLAHTRIVEYLVSAWPDAVTESDYTGKIPLHWAASAKNNSRTYNLLVQAGADEQAVDYKIKTPTYYKHKPSDIDRSLLTVIPDAPRIPQQGPPNGFDWNLFGDEEFKQSNSNNNLMRKSQSNYESYSVLSDDPTPGTIKRHSSTEVLRNGNALSTPSSSMARHSRSPSVHSPDVNLENLGIDGSTPLTTEEQAVLVAINPENELLYRSSGSTAEMADGDHNNNKAESETTHLDQVDNIVLDNGDPQPSDNADDDEALSGDGEAEMNGGYEEGSDANVEPAEDEVGTEENEDGEEEEGEKEAEAEDEKEADQEETEEDENEADETEKVEDGVEGELEADSEAADEEAAEEDAELEGDPPDEQEDNQNAEEMEQNAEDEPDLEQELEPEATEENEELVDVNNEGDDNGNEADPNEEVEKEEDPDTLAQEDEPPEPTEEVANGDADANDHDHASDGEGEENTEHEELVANGEDAPEVAHNTEVSPSPALEIEGVVTGEADNGGVQSEGGNFRAEDATEESKIKAIIGAGDMEQLASMVLNGEGRMLIEQSSDQPEIQAFLENVPAYMNKIRRVHLAAREGSLRDLQSALDRRKFAVAKDQVSPNGATPLHVSTIFGHAGIVRYLAGRFPETTSAVDNNGRTALHYAATLKDNGHFFNLLTNLGANPKAEDNLGNSAEFYMDHEQSEGILSHRQILGEFGAETVLADDMLNDQELIGEHRVEIPLFRTEEGRYLATTLGDPLIKGLTEVANSRPSDPIAFLANYLHGFSKQNNMNTTIAEATPSTAAMEENPPAQQRRQPIQPAFVAAADEPVMDDSPELAQTSDDRDEHGQSLLHFACARSHAPNALVQLIEESGVSLTYRDELYRTARDVSFQASQGDNAVEIDRFVIGYAARGEIDFFEHLLLEGYDHIRDITDSDDQTIVQVARSRGQNEMVAYLEGIREFEESRELLHRAIRTENMETVQSLLSRPDGARLARAKNYYGRCAIHVAVLHENEETVEYIATRYKQTLRLGDNLDRTPLHYAMGVVNVEALSRILIKCGAKRVLKDLKGRQPSYYFMNKADISRLKEEEEEDQEEDQNN